MAFPLAIGSEPRFARRTVPTTRLPAAARAWRANQPETTARALSPAMRRSRSVRLASAAAPRWPHLRPRAIFRHGPFVAHPWRDLRRLRRLLRLDLGPVGRWVLL